MSLSRALILISLAGLMAACSTTQDRDHDSDFMSVSSAPVMRHNLREIVQYDAYKMGQLVNTEINLREPDEDIFLRNVANVLAETALIQPDFSAREGALREIKSKVEQEDYSYVLGLASDLLLDVVRSSNVSSDQASAFEGLQNLVIEARSLKRPELKPTLQKIADAKITLNSQAKDYARESMEDFISPSAEALAALNPVK